MKKINNISVCLISKNNQETIKRTLDSVYNIFDEIIIIDTGSTDKTIEISKKYTDKIFSYEWKNDFSDARNYAYKYVKNDWLFWIDTDEEFVLFDLDALKKLLYSDKESLFINRFDILPNNEKGISLKCRFLRNIEINYFYGKIHEAPIKINEAKSFIINENIALINHYPIFENKKNRNIKILEDIISKTKDELELIDYLIYLVKEIDEDTKKELLLLEISSKMKFLEEKIIKENTNFLNFFNEIIVFHIEKKQYTEALKYCDVSLKYFPNNIVTLSMKGEIYFRLKDFEKSLYFYENIIKLVNDNKFFKGAYIYESIKSYGTLYNIALCYKEINNLEKCIDYLNLSLEIKPNFEPAVILLKNLINNISYTS